MYDSFLRISRALHPDVFDQPEIKYSFNCLLVDQLRSQRVQKVQDLKVTNSITHELPNSATALIVSSPP